MKIPKQVHLLGHTIKVKQNSKLVQHQNDFGQASFVGQTIKLAGKARGKPVTRTHLEHTFFHELVHQCLWAMGETELNENEKFVDLMGALLHQSLEPHMK
jgi:hypothetical protein